MEVDEVSKWGAVMKMCTLTLRKILNLGLLFEEEK